MRYYSFTPIYFQRVWGGRGLETKLGRTLPDDAPYGESWEIVDRAEAQSIVADGSEQGKTLRELLQTRTSHIMGKKWPAERPFPILVKWLDCAERLSLQVHPPAAVAGELGGEPKTENWYIAETEPGAALIVGLKPGVTQEAFAKALEAQELEGLVHRFEVQPGESIFVPSGRIHAIDGGNLILEIQQNSDTTYRVYDWGRTGLDGKPRELHIDESLKSIDWDDTEPQPLRPDPQRPVQVLADSDVFRLTRQVLAKGEELTFGAGEEPRLLSVVKGKLVEQDGSVLDYAGNVLLPHGEAFTFTAEEEAQVIITDHFA